MTTDLKELIERAKGIDGDFAEMNPGMTMQYVHALAERLEAELCAVVNPLEWSTSIKDQCWLYASIVGEYRVSKTRNKSNDRYMVTYLTPTRKSETIGYFDGEESAKAAAQSDYDRRSLSAITIRSATDVAAEARAVAIEAAASIEDNRAVKFKEAGSLSNMVAEEERAKRIRAIHGTDTLAAIERIKEQARKEERERLTDIIRMYPKPHINRIIESIMDDE